MTTYNSSDSFISWLDQMRHPWAQADQKFE